MARECLFSSWKSSRLASPGTLFYYYRYMVDMVRVDADDPVISW